MPVPLRPGEVLGAVDEHAAVRVGGALLPAHRVEARDRKRQRRGERIGEHVADTLAEEVVVLVEPGVAPVEEVGVQSIDSNSGAGTSALRRM